MILVKGLQRYQRSKLEDKKNICRMARFEPVSLRSAALADIFFVLQLWPLISLQPLDQNQCLIPHLKDLLRISLEDKAQGFWTSLKVCNLGLIKFKLVWTSLNKYEKDKKDKQLLLFFCFKSCLKLILEWSYFLFFLFFKRKFNGLNIFSRSS